MRENFDEDIVWCMMVNALSIITCKLRIEILAIKVSTNDIIARVIC